jgi:hypothetical protein
MEVLTDLEKNLAELNVPSIDPTPPDVTISKAENSELLLAYGKHVILVPFTITCRLNMELDNGSQAEQAWLARLQSTNDTIFTATPRLNEPIELKVMDNPIIIGLIGLVILVIAGGFGRRASIHHQ